MTQQELKYLRRTKLREMLLEQYRENEQLQSQIKQLQEQMEQREIVIDNAGSIAEAAMQLNGVFDSAQKACDQYAESVEKLQERSRRICSRMEKTHGKSAGRWNRKPRKNASRWRKMRKNRLTRTGATSLTKDGRSKIPAQCSKHCFPTKYTKTINQDNL